MHGPMEGVTHDKFYIVVGISSDEIFVCSVLINSNINPFILRRPRLLMRQIKISHETYAFLNYDSYVNCAQPLKIKTNVFEDSDYTVKAHLTAEDLDKLQKNVIASGELSKRDIDDFFGH